LKEHLVIQLLGRFYIGYNISPSGSIVGFLWGCADGGIFGLAFGGLYNFITREFSPLITG
jgi:hypothetical protein